MTEMLGASNFENSNSWNLEGTAEEDFDEPDLLDGDTFIQPKNDVWPQACYCCDNTVYEGHGNVSFVLPWIQENLRKRNLEISCTRK